MNEKDYLNWLSKLQVGDKVSYQEKFGEKEIIVTTIKKITPKRMFRMEHEDVLFNPQGYTFYGGKTLGIRMYPPSKMLGKKMHLDALKETKKTFNEVTEYLYNNLESLPIDELKRIQKILQSI